MDGRAATAADEPLLREMLWLAANWRDESAAGDQWPDEDVPRRYAAGLGRPGDAGVIAEVDGQPVGAAWYRLLPASDPGYGHVADDVPELTIAVVPAQRGHGVGEALLGRLEEVAAADGVRALSLSVEPDNPALRLYERAGFAPAGERDGSLTLVATL